MEFVDALEHNGQMYQAFFPVETEGEELSEEEAGLVILKVIHEDGEDLLSTLDSDEEEEAVYKRGRNTNSLPPKNAVLRDYKSATGIEALIGYLYLMKNSDRIKFLMKYLIDDFN